MQRKYSLVDRRTMIQLGSVAGIAMLAGCVDQISGVFGDEYEPGDDEAAMINVDYFGDGWIEEDYEPDDDGPDDDDDEPDWESGTSRLFYTEDDDEAVIAMMGIAEDSDSAAEAIDDWATANIVGGEEIDLGDGGERGEIEGFGAVAFSHSNAGIITMAGRMAGFDIQAQHGKAYEVGEALLDNLQDL